MDCALGAMQQENRRRIGERERERKKRKINRDRGETKRRERWKENLGGREVESGGREIEEWRK